MFYVCVCEFYMDIFLSFTLYLRQREPSIKTFRFLLSAIVKELCIGWRNFTPRFASTPQQRNENIKYYISFSIEPTICRIDSHTLVSLR